MHNIPLTPQLSKTQKICSAAHVVTRTDRHETLPTVDSKITSSILLLNHISLS